MLGVDRLDMIKGIPQKLLAFEKFLHEHPEWRDKVLLVQVSLQQHEAVVAAQDKGVHLRTVQSPGYLSGVAWRVLWPCHAPQLLGKDGGC